MAGQGLDGGAQPPQAGAGAGRRAPASAAAEEATAMFFAGPDGRVGWANAAGLRAVVVGRSWAAALHLQEVPTAPAAVRVTWVDADDVQRAGLLTIEPLHGGVVGVISDVTTPAPPAAGGVDDAPVVALARESRRRVAAWALAGALERDELVICYQPVSDLVSGRVVAAEAMICWRHAELGMSTHEEVMSLGQDAGLDVTLGWWLLEAAVRQASRWASDPLLTLQIGVQITLTPAHLAQRDLAERTAAMLDAHTLPRDALTILVSERALSAALGGHPVRGGLGSLRRRGIRVGLTHFGTGTSSLAQLQADPVDVLLLDPSLVEGMASGSAEQAIVATVLGMAQTLGMQAIAAGVADGDQIDVLRRLGCRRAQGPLPGQPVGPQALAVTAGRREPQRREPQPPQDAPMRTSTAAGTAPSRR